MATKKTNTSKAPVVEPKKVEKVEEVKETKPEVKVEPVVVKKEVDKFWEDPSYDWNDDRWKGIPEAEEYFLLYLG